MGSTLYRSGGQWRTQDHPHIHGEHSGDTLSGIASQGSPPYTWGAPGKIKITNTATRITPIYMGSTRPRSYSGSSYKDHPHIHGEHPFVTQPLVPNRGSPPYTWGALCSIRCSINCSRITPIYMGSTASYRLVKATWEDHPHIHGEHFITFPIRFFEAGSPPYTWGAPLFVRLEHQLAWITPIYMGSTDQGTA